MVKRPFPLSWQKVMVVAVHPDDESLAAGGLIQHAIARGADVRVIFVTDGDNNPWPQRFVERRWHLDAVARARWGKRRRVEALAALASLGVSQENISFWHYPDQGLTKLLLTGDEGLLARLSAEILQWQPTVLVSPSMRDLHPDHNAFAVFLHFALERDTFLRVEPFARLEYLVHTHDAAVSGDHIEISLSPRQVIRKRQAILSHATQMALSRRRFLAFAKASEVFLVPNRSVPFDPDHPVMAADSVDGYLCLKIWRVTSSATLLVAADGVAGLIWKVIRLSPRAEPTICDETSGEIQTDAHLTRGRDYDELFFPAAWFAPARSLAVKFSLDRGFYDRSGWRLLQLASVSSVPGGKIYRKGRPRVCCVIPCYNIADLCGPVVRAAADFADQVIAVNDGSSDSTERVLREIAEACPGRVQVLSFPVNRGKGIALLDAFRRASDTIRFDILVTLDGDGQHRPEDMPRLARTMMIGNYALVIGERLARACMPLRSRIGNSLTAALMRFFHPDAPVDTQSGFRAFRRDFVREIIETIDGGRYETELEILLLALRQSRRIGSVTIPTVYLEGNRHSHFRPISDSWRIYRTLFHWQFNPGLNQETKTPVAANR